MKDRSTPSGLPELLLPAGGLEAGIAAFEGGADAVYLGFSEFSARKQARNFSREEYRRILGAARSGGKRVYVTINTVLLDSELPALAELLSFLERFPPDAILFQDWGVAALVRARFPGIPLHASTQTAIQGPEAARLAYESGVSRLVLPRECGLAELRRLKREVPELEYEVFVHGALCYSFSGLCLASGLLLGRSGNRGECAQVCRSYYRVEGPGPGPLPEGAEGLEGREGYWFSCRDNCQAASLGELAEAGAASLKVEGRMKAPEYCYAVARLYRAELDRLSGVPKTEAELEELRLQASLAFGRRPTEAYLRDPRGVDLLDSSYPGHRGLPAGKVLSCRRSGGRQAAAPFRAVVELSSPLGLRDGLLAFLPGEGKAGVPAGLPAPLLFAVTGLADAATGRPLVHAKSGGEVEIDSPEALEPGTELSRVSAREYDRRAISPEEYEAAVQSIPATLSVELEAPGRGILLLALAAEGGRVLRDSASLPLFPARKAGGFAAALGRFAENGGYDFRLEVGLEAGAAVELDGSRLPLADLFVPPSDLKAAKNRLYEAAAALLEGLSYEKADSAASIKPDEAAATFPAAPSPSAGAAEGEGGPLPGGTPPRAALVFPREGLASGLPFATPRVLAEGLELPAFGSADGSAEGAASYLPLSPLVADWDSYAAAARSRIEAELGAGKRLVVGLDCLHHIAFARELLLSLPDTSRLSFFGDIHLYAANRLSRAVYARLVPRLAFSYEYLELKERPKPDWLAFIGEEAGPETEAASALADAAAAAPGSEPPALSPAPIGEGFEPPLFISRGCFIRHHLGGGSCLPSCGRSLALRLADRGRRYVLLVEDCITMLFREAS